MHSTILIDTHVVIWLYENRARIGRDALRLLDDTDQSVAVGYISLMEMAIKNAADKLHYDDKIFDDLAAVNIQIAMPGRITLSKYQIFSLDNKDPFDNLLIATALENKYAFMTADNKILSAKIPGLRTIDATK
jgi:PIN domain nuclease of toxin-antitoxin system